MRVGSTIKFLHAENRSGADLARLVAEHDAILYDYGVSGTDMIRTIELEAAESLALQAGKRSVVMRYRGAGMVVSPAA